jgi:hypothetical protein
MTDSRGRRGEGERTPVWAGLPFAILDGLWPTGFTLYSRHKRSNEQWIDVLEREVDRGLLRRVGDGSTESPFRYEEVAEGVCQRPSFVTTLDDASTQRLLARLGLSDAQ